MSYKRILCQDVRLLICDDPRPKDKDRIWPRNQQEWEEGALIDGRKLGIEKTYGIRRNHYQHKNRTID